MLFALCLYVFLVFFCSCELYFSFIICCFTSLINYVFLTVICCKESKSRDWNICMHVILCYIYIFTSHSSTPRPSKERSNWYQEKLGILILVLNMIQFAASINLWIKL